MTETHYHYPVKTIICDANDAAARDELWDMPRKHEKGKVIPVVVRHGAGFEEPPTDLYIPCPDSFEIHHILTKDATAELIEEKKKAIKGFNRNIHMWAVDGYDKSDSLCLYHEVYDEVTGSCFRVHDGRIGNTILWGTYGWEYPEERKGRELDHSYERLLKSEKQVEQELASIRSMISHHPRNKEYGK